MSRLLEKLVKNEYYFIVRMLLEQGVAPTQYSLALAGDNKRLRALLMEYMPAE